jgi:hypothetical protein
MMIGGKYLGKRSVKAARRIGDKGDFLICHAGVALLEPAERFKGRNCQVNFKCVDLAKSKGAGRAFSFELFDFTVVHFEPCQRIKDVAVTYDGQWPV